MHFPTNNIEVNFSLKNGPNRWVGGPRRGLAMDRTFPLYLFGDFPELKVDPGFSVSAGSLVFVNNHHTHFSPSLWHQASLPDFYSMVQFQVRIPHPTKCLVMDSSGADLTMAFSSSSPSHPPLQSLLPIIIKTSIFSWFEHRNQHIIWRTSRLRLWVSANVLAKFWRLF